MLVAGGKTVVRQPRCYQPSRRRALIYQSVAVTGHAAQEDETAFLLSKFRKLDGSENRVVCTVCTLVFKANMHMQSYDDGATRREPITILIIYPLTNFGTELYIKRLKSCHLPLHSGTFYTCIRLAFHAIYKHAYIDADWNRPPSGRLCDRRPRPHRCDIDKGALVKVYKLRMIRDTLIFQILTSSQFLSSTSHRQARLLYVWSVSRSCRSYALHAEASWTDTTIWAR